MSRPLEVAVVGAGFAGLAAAWDLAGKGHRVTVYEAGDQPGGLAAGYRDPSWDWTLEHFYHHWFTSDAEIKRLAEELGVADRILTLDPVTAQFVAGKAYALDGVLPVLRFPVIPLVDRLRLGLCIAWLKVLPDWRPLERVTARAWLRRWMGRAAFETVFDPLLSGKFGAHADRIPMSWLWARLKSRTPKLMYYAGGFQAFADRMVEGLLERGGGLRYGVPVKRIEAEEAGGLRLTAAGETRTYDRVIVTTGPQLLARMAPGLPADYLAGLEGLPYLGAVVALLSLDRPLMDRVYWLSMDKRDFPFLACVEHTNFAPAARYGGEHLVYVGDYLPADHRYFDMTPEAILDEWLPSLARINPDFDASWLRRSWLQRARYAQPVVEPGFSARIPPLETPIPGLYLASMTQVYPWDRGTNYAVELGRQVAARIGQA
ncbi:MAG: NAD(P)/FAD-dependent oxidoreductase [Chloroflexi bacterium]|nr:NAD(P)/FAD-dependent oxidoreductase [Chloroflexota bacterium]